MDYVRASGYVIDDKGRRQFTNRDIPNGVGGTSIEEEFLNGVQNTLIDVLIAFGITPDIADDSLLTKAILAAVATEKLRATGAEASILGKITDETKRASAAEQQIAIGWQAITASTSIAVPNWASRVEAICVGGGGGGGGCQGSSAQQSVSGGGGASGAYVHGIYAVTGGALLTVSIGAGGAGVVGPGNASAGGTTSLAINNKTLCQSPGGGGATWSGVTDAAGGVCSNPVTSDGTLCAAAGNNGSDGQSSQWVGFGNGAAGPWGGAGRAGSKGGRSGAGPGAGGGGAYDAGMSGSIWTGGSGYQGLVLHRFLP